MTHSDRGRQEELFCLAKGVGKRENDIAANWPCYRSDELNDRLVRHSHGVFEDPRRRMSVAIFRFSGNRLSNRYTRMFVSKRAATAVKILSCPAPVPPTAV
jgi:hypothetical protein